MIGFCGPASTGKTTVAKELSSTLGEKYEPSVVRSIAERWEINEPISLRMPIDLQIQYQYEILNAKLAQDESLRRGIFDRTPIDQLSYMCIKCGHALPDELFKSFVDSVHLGMRMYDVIVFFPVYEEIPYANDGFRICSRAYQLTQESVMRYWLNELDISYHEMPMGTVSQRLTVARQIIDAKRRG